MNPRASVPHVKVVLTTFRRATLLDEALASAFGQVEAAVHVVVVDDHSNDDTYNVMHRAAERWSGRITLIAKSANRGIADSIRAGVEAGPKAPYVAFLNDDDRWLPNKLTRQLAELSANPAISACFSDAFVIDATGSRTGKLYSEELGPFISCTYEQLLQADPVCASTLVLRCDVAEHVARTIPDNVAGAWDYYAVLVAAGQGELVRISAPLAEYRVWDGSLRLHVVEAAQSTTAARLAAVKEFASTTATMDGERATQRLIAVVTLKEALMRLECRQWRAFLWQATVVVRQRRLRTVASLALHTITTLLGHGPMRDRSRKPDLPRRWDDVLGRSLRALLTPRLVSSNNRHEQPLADLSVDVYTFVTDDAQYHGMITSFRQAGFRDEVTFTRLSDRDSEPFSALSEIGHEVGAPYAILCHQDIRLPLESGPEQLLYCLRLLEERDARWRAAGSAGVVGNLGVARQVYDVWGGFSDHELPAPVMSLDECFLVLNRRNRPRCTVGVHGFHWYGTDLCVNARADGGSAYVIPYPVIHLGLGDLRPGYRAPYDETLAALVPRWSRNTRACYIASTVDVVALSRHRCVRRVLASGRLTQLVSNERQRVKLGLVPESIVAILPAVNVPGSSRDS